MVSFPIAKINLGLNIISKRLDGYHNIDSCFYPISWHDILEVIPSDNLKFTSSGHPIPGDPQSNLCLKAYQLLKTDFNIPPVHIHLHKIIPIGAGLGGGSADASYTLKMLNEKFQLGISTQKLKSYAAQLGSDCPFFIEDKPVIARGTGTQFESIDFNLTGKIILLINPDIHISTAEAYAGIVPKESGTPIKEILSNCPIESWKSKLHNDFEDSVFSSHPQIAKIKELLYDSGALYASMSGTGSAVYGIFEKQPIISSRKGWATGQIAL